MEEHKISVGIFWGKKGRLLMKASAISALQFETGAIKEEWLKVTRAIIGMKFTVPISVTLNSDDFYPAISIDRIQNVVFSPSTESGKIIMSPSKFREKVLGSTSEEIREEFRHLLR